MWLFVILSFYNFVIISGQKKECRYTMNNLKLKGG